LCGFCRSLFEVVLAKQGTLAPFSCPVAHAQNGVAKHKDCHILETAHAFMIARCFGCVCYVLLASRKCTKLIGQSIECVFLGYRNDHKGYRCCDLISRRMRTSQDVVFDKSDPFYPRPSS
jgi:hypothetical protein